VLIAGRPVKSGGRLIHVDTADIIGAARESQHAITLRRRAA
jgi:hypothetical protein